MTDPFQVIDAEIAAVKGDTSTTSPKRRRSTEDTTRRQSSSRHSSSRHSRHSRHSSSRHSSSRHSSSRHSSSRHSSSRRRRRSSSRRSSSRRRRRRRSRSRSRTRTRTTTTRQHNRTTTEIEQPNAAILQQIMQKNISHLNRTGKIPPVDAPGVTDVPGLHIPVQPIASVTLPGGVPGQVTNEMRHERELYVRGFPANLPAETLVQFLNLYVKDKNLVHTPGDPIVRANMSSDGSYAFVEVRSLEETSLFVNVLNGIPILNGILRVGRPKNYSGPETTLIPMQLPVGVSAEKMLRELEQGIMKDEPSPVVELINFLTEETLNDPELDEDIREECKSYGTVVDLRMPKTGEENLPVYVHFANSDQAFMAIQKLSGRTFDNNRIQAKYFPLNKFTELKEKDAAPESVPEPTAAAAPQTATQEATAGQASDAPAQQPPQSTAQDEMD